MKKTSNKDKSPATLTVKELRLVDWTVGSVNDKLSNVNVQVWTQATDNIRRPPANIKIDPELREALIVAVKSLKGIPAPTLSKLLGLWQGAVAFTAREQKAPA
jgi:hypothetical protein